MAKNNLEPMSEIMKKLRKEGFNSDFIMKGNKLFISSGKKSFNPEEIKIVDEYRFEGNTNPDDMSILYALEANTGEKGLIVNAYGVSADADLDQFLMQASSKKS